MIIFKWEIESCANTKKGDKLLLFKNVLYFQFFPYYKQRKTMCTFSAFLFLLVLFIQTSHQQESTSYAQYSVPKTSVLTFNHCLQAEQALDPLKQQNIPAYYHIITPLRKGDHIIFRFDLTGFSYGAALPLDITWSGYNTNTVQVLKAVNINRNANLYSLPLESYYQNDGRLALTFGPIHRYCNGFQLFYQGHAYHSYQKGLERENYQVIVTYTDHRLT